MAALTHGLQGILQRREYQHYRLRVSSGKKGRAYIVHRWLRGFELVGLRGRFRGKHVPYHAVLSLFELLRWLRESYELRETGGVTSSLHNRECSGVQFKLRKGRSSRPSSLTSLPSSGHFCDFSALHRIV